MRRAYKRDGWKLLSRERGTRGLLAFNGSFSHRSVPLSRPLKLSLKEHAVLIGSMPASSSIGVLFRLSDAKCSSLKPRLFSLKPRKIPTHGHVLLQHTSTLTVERTYEATYLNVPMEYRGVKLCLHF